MRSASSKWGFASSACAASKAIEQAAIALFALSCTSRHENNVLARYSALRNK